MYRCLTALLVALVFAAVSCSSQTEQVSPEQLMVPDTAFQSGIDDLPFPAGVSPELFDQLKQELSRQLADPAAGRTTAAPPPNDNFRVQLDLNEGEDTLSWSYHSTGDYDQNGEVNAADLTPLALHFSESGDFEYSSAQSVIDGDGNGEINLADVTPIAINFLNTVSGYNIYASENEGDIPAGYPDASVIDPLATVGLGQSASDRSVERLRFSYLLEPGFSGYMFWARPTDGTTEGMPSVVVGLPDQLPTAVLEITPWPGLPLGAEFDASASTDIDGTITAYDYDIDNDGTAEYSGSEPLFATAIPAAGDYDAKLTVTDDIGGQHSVIVAYTIADGIINSGGLDPAGGNLDLADIELSVDPGFLLGPVEFTEHQTLLPPGLPESFEPWGPAINLELSDEDLLNGPVDMTFPWFPPAQTSALSTVDNMSVLYHDPNRGWMPTTITQIDRDNNELMVDSRRFGVFVVGWFNIGLIHGGIDTPGGYTILFNPEFHGWNINNFGNFYSPGGNCYGMAAYCTWFYEERSLENLNGKFSAAGGRPVSIAHLMAARTHMAQSQYWAKKEWNTQMTSEEGLVGLTMKIYLKVFEQPQVLTLGVAGAPRHACVLYGWDETGFIFYDVNSKDTVQNLPWDANSGFGMYGNYNSFGIATNPSHGRAEDFEQLTQEGEGGFASSQDIHLTTPLQDEEISGLSANITGWLGGGLTSEVEIVAYVNGMTYPVAVNAGNFSAWLPIVKGDNTIILMAGATSFNDFKRNGATLIREVTCLGWTTEIMVAGSWSVDKADLDLYVVEPNDGPPVWPGSQRTAKFLRMMQDNDEGYGPEQVILATEASGEIVPGQYKVRMHYRQDLGGVVPTGPVSGRVCIVLNSGEPDESFRFVPFSLQSADPDNTDYLATGPDWADVATFDVVTGVITPL